MTDTQIAPEVITQHGLTFQEYDRICEMLGRKPTLTELGIFSVMWSEHCSYKSSRVHLKRLPTKGENVVQGPGENAGIIDIGGDWCVAFKIESHNHPSYIEPFQGAATGVGGILRDIFTMGARPVAAMNSLRFGSLESGSEVHRNRSIMNGVVRGIGSYGNSFGVPTIGGEVSFAPVYSLNPLVNAFALGVVKRDQIFLGKAEGVGNPVLYVGAKTGRDGIHGATMASAEFDEEAMEKRPTVQVGDPFYEKLLLESCLEAMRSGAVVGIQDMGAAGLTCSTCEMGGRAGNGVEIELTLVPQRESGMTPYEIMLSESQERMLLVAEKGREREVIDIFKKWELDAVVIGIVTDDGLMRVKNNGEIVAEIPNECLTDLAPVYNRPLKPRDLKTLAAKEIKSLVEANNVTPTEALRKLLSSPNIASKEWVYRQYDHMVRTNTIVSPGSDSAVIRLKETRKALAMTLDGNGRYCQLNPREGIKLVVAEAARNLVCSGAKPLAVTNCLNFASPERPEVMWDFSETIDGLTEACTAFGTPVTGGNVSFYNETEGRGIYPTPVIGMVGLSENTNQIVTSGFKNAGDLVVLIGETKEDLGGTEFLERVCGQVAGELPQLDLEKEKSVQNACLEAIRVGLINSAHDCSDGGLAVTLAESCFSSHGREAIGAELEWATKLSSLAELFSESPSRIVVSVSAANLDSLAEICGRHNAPYTAIGRIGGMALRITLNGEQIINEQVSALENIWRNVFSSLLDEPKSEAAD